MTLPCWTTRIYRDASGHVRKWIPYGPAHVARQHAWNLKHPVAARAARWIVVTTCVVAPFATVTPLLAGTPAWQDWRPGLSAGDYGCHRGHDVRLPCGVPSVPSVPIPEPGTLVLLGAGVVALGVVRRRA